MGEDQIPGPFDKFKLRFILPNLNGLEREEAIKTLDDWLKRHGNKRGNDR